MCFADSGGTIPDDEGRLHRQRDLRARLMFLLTATGVLVQQGEKYEHVVKKFPKKDVYIILKLKSFPTVSVHSLQPCMTIESVM